MRIYRINTTFISLWIWIWGMVSSATAVEDGVYLLKEGSPDSIINLPGGGAGAVDRKLSEAEYNLRIESRTNWNDAFSILLNYVSLSSSAEVPPLAISVGGILYSPVGSMREQLKVLSGAPKFVFPNLDLAKRMATIKGAKLHLRKHLSQKLAFRLVVGNEPLKLDQQVEIALEIQNVGEKPVFVALEAEGASGQSFRSSNFSLFPDELCAASCIDVRNGSKRASFLSVVELKPGGTTIVKKERLSNWYQPQVEGRYTFIGAYSIGVYETLTDTLPVWDEYLAGSFDVTFEQ